LRDALKHDIKNPTNTCHCIYVCTLASDSEVWKLSERNVFHYMHLYTGFHQKGGGNGSSLCLANRCCSVSSVLLRVPLREGQKQFNPNFGWLNFRRLYIGINLLRAMNNKGKGGQNTGKPYGIYSTVSTLFE
jgi:hypothetical protein